MARTKSTARAWKSAPGPNQAFRDNETIRIDGQAVRVWGYGPTKAKATADLRRKVALRLAAAAVDSSPSVTTVFAQMLRFKRNLKGRKHSTIHGSLDLFKRHIRPHVGEIPLELVTLEELQGIQSRLTTAGKWRTAEMATIMLKGIWRHHGRQVRARVKHGKTPFHDVTMDLEQVQRPPEAATPEEQTWTTDQLAAFLAEAKRVYDTKPISLL